MDHVSRRGSQKDVEGGDDRTRVLDMMCIQCSTYMIPGREDRGLTGEECLIEWMRRRSGLCVPGR
jgi:hypothetical protein